MPRCVAIAAGPIVSAWGPDLAGIKRGGAAVVFALNLGLGGTLALTLPTFFVRREPARRPRKANCNEGDEPAGERNSDELNSANYPRLPVVLRMAGKDRAEGAIVGHPWRVANKS
jgi:hypothetical protein